MGVTGSPPSLFDDYVDALARSDPATAMDLVLELLDSGASLADIVTDVLAPAQAWVGERWERGEWSVGQEHTATAVTEAAVSALWVMTSRQELGDGPRVGVACAEGEWHALPPRMMAALAAEAGADVTVLGPSMPADDLRRRLEAGDLDVLALSCTVPGNLVGAARCVAAAHAAGVPVVVGGAAFAGRQRRAAAIGADRLSDDPRRLALPPPAVGPDIVISEEVVCVEAADVSVQALRGRMERDQMRWALRYTAAALLVADPTVLDDYLAWLLRSAQDGVAGRGLLGRASLDGIAAVAVGIESISASGAHLLREAAGRARVASRTDSGP